MVDLIPNFSVVVLGAMNPRIHHPFWYELIKVISEDERKASLALPVIVTPAAAQFSWMGFTIICTADRWEMRSREEKDLQRVVETAATIFDRLNDTPVTAFGINCDHVIQKPDVDFAGALAAAIGSARLGMPGESACDGQLLTRRKVTKKDTRLTLSLGVSTTVDSPSQLRIANNFHHEIAIETEQASTVFEMKPLLVDALKEALDMSKSQTESILKAYPWGTV